MCIRDRHEGNTEFQEGVIESTISAIESPQGAIESTTSSFKSPQGVINSQEGSLKSPKGISDVYKRQQVYLLMQNY